VMIGKSLVTIAIVLAGGCSSRVALTRELVDKYGVQVSDLPTLQYFVSSQIDLRREHRLVDRQPQGDKLKGKEEIYREHVYVLPDTPGVAEDGNLDLIWVSFEKGSRFQFKYRCDPQRTEKTGLYYLTPDRVIGVDERLSQEVPLGMYVFDYRGEAYYSQNTDNIFLRVKLKDLIEIQETKRRLRGRKVK